MDSAASQTAVLSQRRQPLGIAAPVNPAVSPRLLRSPAQAERHTLPSGQGRVRVTCGRPPRPEALQGDHHRASEQVVALLAHDGGSVPGAGYWHVEPPQMRCDELRRPQAPGTLITDRLILHSVTVQA